MNKALETIYNALQAGKRFGVNELQVRFPCFHTVLMKTQNNFIYYCHFGSSHIKNDLHELEWLLQVIFKLSPTEFLQRYTMQ